MHTSSSPVAQQLITTLQQGGIAVVRTDTLYGIIALASNEEAVANIYAAKQRDPSKQCIVLLSDATMNTAYADIIAQHSNNEKPTSVIVPVSDEPAWIVRDGDSVAYRVVRDDLLKEVIAVTGPVIAPSANPEGLPPAMTIDEAKAYFTDFVDLYIDGGTVPADIHASRIVRINPDDTEAIVRAA